MTIHTNGLHAAGQLSPLSSGPIWALATVVVAVAVVVVVQQKLIMQIHAN